jgi:hypothetical protein
MKITVDEVLAVLGIEFGLEYAIVTKSKTKSKNGLCIASLCLGYLIGKITRR